MLDNLKTFRFSLLNQANLIGLLLLISFFVCRNPASKWDKTISGDGKSYYAYLTTALIYHDLDYQFIEDYEAKYYPPDKSLFKEFRQDFNGRITNKTFPGITILWLPFFLLAHFLSYLFGFETDGYSLLYQYSIGFASIFYVWLGLKWLHQLLKSLGYKWIISLIVLLSLTFGSNLFYYTIFDPSLTHAYNFTLLAGILLFIRRFYFEQKSKFLAFAILLLSLAIIIRPTNFLMVLFLPFALGDLIDLKVFLRSISSNKKLILLVIGIPLSIGLVPIIWWYLQTGQLIIYSYAQERFNFSNPHFFKILFSYEKGWLIYSPIISLSALGLIHFFKTKRLWFYTGLFGFSILAYIFSCWWIWTYGASFGQRVFVDYYAIIAILLAGGLQLIYQQKVLITLWFVCAISFIGLNLLQTYQFQNGILPTTNVTKQTYWNSFFKLKAVKRSYPIEIPYQRLASYKTDFESNSAWLTSYEISKSKSNSGENSQCIDLNKPFSGGFDGGIPNGTDFVQVSASIYCKSNSVDPKLVFDLKNQKESIHYQSIGLMPYLSKNEWTTFSYNISLKSFSASSLSTYFWNPSDDKIWIDNLEIIFGKYQ